MQRPYLALSILFFLFFLTFSGCSRTGDNTYAPDFTIDIIAGTNEKWIGKTITLSELRGRPVVIHFAASWCDACKRIFQVLSDDYEDLFVMGIGVMDSRKNFIEFAKAQALPAPIGYDEDGTITSNYKVNTLPLTVFIDRDGRLAKRFLGMLDTDRLKDILENVFHIQQ
jgi:thiol-disulfide isomerase/thioredoxin